MTFRGVKDCDIRRISWAFAMLAVVMLTGFQARAADEPDLIFRRSTVFKLLSPNDKLATYGVDDPEIDGVACHFTVPEKGGIKGWLGLAEQVSDISLSCRQIGPIHFKGKMEQGEDMFRQRRSLFFKIAAQAAAVSLASAGRTTSSPGIARNAARCSIGWWVGPSSPRPIESWVQT